VREKIHGKTLLHRCSAPARCGPFFVLQTAAASASLFMTPLRVVNCAVTHRVDHQSVQGASGLLSGVP
jgi:hypothetical protein